MILAASTEACDPSMRLADTKGGRTRGERPSRSWKPEKLVEAVTLFIMLKRIMGITCTHPFWLCSMWYCTAWLTVLLERSEAPSISGWKEEERFKCTPVSLCSACQNLEIKSLSRSDMISAGSLFSQYQFSKKMVANFSAIISVRVGISLISEPIQSVIVRRQLKPSSSGRGPMKSIAMLLPCSSGIGSGCSRPAGLVVLDLFCWQGTHPGMKDCSRSLCIFGQ